MKSCFLKLIVFFCACSVFFSLNSCDSSSKINYYSKKENYISVTGTVVHIKYNEDSTALYIGFSETTPTLDDLTFKLVEKNLEIAQDAHIDDKLKIGDQITFITAPKYFGDGYVMPIVAITINEENLLEFEDGYKNFLSWLKAQ